MKNLSLKVIPWLLRFCVILQLQFAYSQSITKAEYFFDTEPGIGMGIPIPGFIADTTTGYTFTVTAWQLEAGYHNIYVRVMDSLNNWSVVSTQFFLLNPLETQQVVSNISYRLSKAEYFIDTDPGVGNGIPMFIFSGDTLNQSYTINTIGQTVGAHILCVRTKDIVGKWSVISALPFTIKNTACTPPNANFSSDVVNAGNVTHLTNLSTNVNLGTTYLWSISDPPNTITGTTKDFTYTFSNPGYYDVSLKVSNSDTCTSYWQQKVVVGPALSTSISITGNSVFCYGDSVLLNAPNGSNYQWNNGATTQQITVKSTGSFQVVYTDAYGYGAVSNQVNITVNPVLSLSVDVSPANNALANGSAMANVSGGTGYLYTYNWSTGAHTMMACSLVPGNYSLTVSDGTCPVSRNFNVANLNGTPEGIVKAEYYIDDISLPPHSLTIGYSDTINSFCNVPLTGISAGYHYLFVRVLDTAGLWSFTESVLFNIDSLIIPPIDTGFNLVAAEYFFDDVDPGPGNGIQIALQANGFDIIDQNLPIVLPNTLSQGFHYINLRVYDKRYEWGVISRFFFYTNPATDLFPPQTNINYRLTAAEYFYDSDPGIGNGKPLLVLADDSINMTYTTDLTGLAVGSHKIYVRVKDLVDKWSVVSYASFTIVAPIACTPPVTDFTYTSALAGQPVIFTNTSAPTDTTTTYQWDINNDNTVEYITRNCSFTFPVAGIYAVKLTVNNGGNCIGYMIHHVTVGALLSNLITSSGPTEFCAGGSVTLTAPSGSNYQWTTGESTQGIVVGTSGYYQVAYTDMNNVHTVSNIIIVTVNPLMNITVDVDDANNGLANGSAFANVSGGSSWSYQYLYSTGETLPSATNLAAGGYSVWISDGKCPVTTQFTVHNLNVTSGLISGEYYIDTIPDLGLAHPFIFGQGDTVNTYLHVPVSGLATGMHNIVVRFKESTGLWTIPYQFYFFVTDSITPIDTTTPLITTVEYYFDNIDPGPGNGIQVQLPIPSSIIDYNFNVSTLGLSSGFHYVSVRVKDDKKNWSIISNMLLYVRPDTIYPQIVSTQVPIILAEYFIDTDPGPGNGTHISVTPGLTIDKNFSVSTLGLDSGYHYVCIRMKDLNNVWSVIGSYYLHIVTPIGCVTPLADFTFNQANAGDVVNFINTSANTNPNTTYNWYITNNLNADFTTVNASYVYPSPGTYDVRMMVSNGSNCQSTIIKQITIGPIISNSITVTGNLEFCLGGSVILTAPAGSNYLWSDGETTSSITVFTSGIYQVVYTDTYGQVRISNSVQVIEHPLMNIVTSVGYANNGLANGSASVSVSGGNSFIYSYFWSNGATTASITGVLPATYSVTVSDGVCSDNRTLIIPNIIGNVPGIIATEYFFDTDPGVGLGTPVAVSMGDSINTSFSASTLGLTAGLHNLLIRVKEGSGVWSVVSSQQIYIYPPETFMPIDTLPYVVAAEYFYNTEPGIGNGTPIPIVTPFSTEDITVNISAVGANFGSNLIGVRVKDNLNRWSVINSTTFMMCNPPASPVAANDTSVCQGSPLTLRASTVANATYSWTGPNGFTSTQQNPVITVDTTKSGYYKVYTLNGGNCYSQPDSIKLTVNIVPAKPGFITGHSETCMSDTVIFFVPLINGATSYDWDFPVPHSIMAGYNTNAIAVRFDAAFSNVPIRVRGHSDCGYGPYSDTFNLVVNSQLPVAGGAISGSASVCQGADSVQYTVPVSNYASSYFWTVPSGATIVSGQGTRTIYVDFSINAISGNVQVQGVNSCGSGVPSANFPVTVHSIPIVSQGTYPDVCSNGSQVALTAGSPAGGTYSGIGIQNGMFNPATAGVGTQSILYTYTNGFGCTGSALSSITVISVISQRGVISGPTLVCQNSLGNVYTVGAIPNATSYVWTLPNGFTGQSTSNTISVNIGSLASSGTISVSGNNNCGIGPSSLYPVTVNPSPTITQSAVSQTICSTGTLSFSAASSAGSIIQWSVDNFLNILGTGNNFTTPIVQVGNTIIVSYRATNSISGCASAIQTVTGTAAQIPTILSVYGDSICGPGVLNLMAIPSNGSVNWYSQSSGGSVLSTGLNYSPSISSTSTFYAEANDNSCLSVSRTSVIAIVKPLPAAPSDSANQYFCALASPTVGNLSPSGNGIKWYNTPSGGNPLALTTPLFNGNHYWASQTVSGCESSARFEVTAYTSSPPAPTGDALQSFNSLATVADLVAIGTNIKWYDAASGGNLLLSTLILTDGTTYYASQTVGNCESQDRLAVTVALSLFKTVKLRLFLEGLFDPNTLNSMVEAQDIDWNYGFTFSKYGAGVADRIQVDLFYGIYPYYPTGVSIGGIDLSTSGYATFQISPLNTGNYYIRVRNRNHLETWSAIPVPFNTNLVEWDFTTSAYNAYQAPGGMDPQVLVGDNLYAFYLGDLDQS
ncbi:MAG: PKD domain-containing protein, partial [Bacteroidota bacterium]